LALLPHFEHPITQLPTVTVTATIRHQHHHQINDHQHDYNNTHHYHNNNSAPATSSHDDGKCEGREKGCRAHRYVLFFLTVKYLTNSLICITLVNEEFKQTQRGGSRLLVGSVVLFNATGRCKPPCCVGPVSFRCSEEVYISPLHRSGSFRRNEEVYTSSLRWSCFFPMQWGGLQPPRCVGLVLFDAMRRFIPLRCVGLVSFRRNEEGELTFFPGTTTTTETRRTEVGGWAVMPIPSKMYV
jgi:hypothetical protein